MLQYNLYSYHNCVIGNSSATGELYGAKITQRQSIQHNVPRPERKCLNLLFVNNHPFHWLHHRYRPCFRSRVGQPSDECYWFRYSLFSHWPSKYIYRVTSWFRWNTVNPHFSKIKIFVVYILKNTAEHVQRDYSCLRINVSNDLNIEPYSNVTDLRIRSMVNRRSSDIGIWPNTSSKRRGIV